MYHPQSSVSRRDEQRGRRAARRRKAAALFARGIHQAEVARRLGVTRTAVHFWHTTWKKKGEAGLTHIAIPGRKPFLTAAQQRQVERSLLKGPQAFGYATDLWTIERVTRLIREVADVSYAPRSAWYVLHTLDWSCQKPSAKPRERDEQAIAHWRKVTWPSLQKRG